MTEPPLNSTVGKWKPTWIWILIFTGHLSLVRGVQLRDKDQAIIPDNISASQSIKINGELNEDAWKLPALEKEFKTISHENPIHEVFWPAIPYSLY